MTAHIGWIDPQDDHQRKAHWVPSYIDRAGHWRCGGADVELVARDAELQHDHDRALVVRVRGGFLVETKHANGPARMTSAITMKFYRSWLLNSWGDDPRFNDCTDTTRKMMLMRVDEAEVYWRVFFRRALNSDEALFEGRPWKPDYVTWKVKT